MFFKEFNYTASKNFKFWGIPFYIVIWEKYEKYLNFSASDFYSNYYWSSHVCSWVSFEHIFHWEVVLLLVIQSPKRRKYQTHLSCHKTIQEKENYLSWVWWNIIKKVLTRYFKSTAQFNSWFNISPFPFLFFEFLWNQYMFVFHHGIRATLWSRCLYRIVHKKCATYSREHILLLGL